MLDDSDPDGSLAAHLAGECDPDACEWCELEGAEIDDLYRDLGNGD